MLPLPIIIRIHIDCCFILYIVFPRVSIFVQQLSISLQFQFSHVSRCQSQSRNRNRNRSRRHTGRQFEKAQMSNQWTAHPQTLKTFHLSLTSSLTFVCLSGTDCIRPCIVYKPTIIMSGRVQ